MDKDIPRFCLDFDQRVLDKNYQRILIEYSKEILFKFLY